MPPRDYESQPATIALGIEAVIGGLVDDLTQLRAGKITVNDAVARANLAKQVFNGMRLYLHGAALLAEKAKPAKICDQGES